MFVRIWRYRVAEANRTAFEAAYRGDGDWARLFARGNHYLGTELLVAPGEGDSGGATYVTIDRWRAETDWRRFHDAHGAAYRALDLECEGLTEDEAEIGDFVGP